MNFEWFFDKVSNTNARLDISRVKNLCECIDIFIDNLEEGDASVEIYENQDEYSFSIIINDIMNIVVDKNDKNFLRLCELADYITISGIPYDYVPSIQDDDERTGIIIILTLFTEGDE